MPDTYRIHISAGCLVALRERIAAFLRSLSPDDMTALWIMLRDGREAKPELYRWLASCGQPRTFARWLLARIESPVEGWMPPADPTFADRLRAACLAAGLSQADLARASGLDPGHVSRLLAGDREPSLDVLRRLGDALGADVVVAAAFAGVRKKV